jgi:REP element-mobilizing transposase RayT
MIVQFLQNSGSMPKREYLSGILPGMEDHLHTLSQAKPPVQGYYIKRRMLRCVSYVLKDVDVCLRKILVGVVPSCSYFHTIE